MIPAEEALNFVATRTRKVRELPALSEEESVALAYVDYTIERGLVDHYDGTMLDIMIPAETAKSPAVIEVLKRRYEDGRWLVFVRPVVEGEMVTAFQMVLAPTKVTVAEKDRVPLPILVPSPSSDVPAPYRLLVRMPTRSRPAQAIEVLAKYKAMAGMPVILEVVIDKDDTSITSEVLYRFHQLGCAITYGDHKSKIEACNGGRVTEWDIVVLASDDMVPVQANWAVRICELFAEHHPHLDGCLHTDDGYSHERVATLSIMGRRYYDLFNYLYHESYKSLFCDDEYGEVARKLGRIVYVPEVLIEHKHPAAGKASLDPLYSVNDKHYEADKATYQKRLAANFDLPEMLLSILICTYPKRRGMLDRLLSYLDDQILSSGYLGQVEIIVDHKPAPTLGEKRQRLLERAKGRLVCFVDDDDMVSYDYIERICEAIEREPDADCISFVGTMTTNGNRPARFEHSLKHRAWITRPDGVHIRSANHLNPIKREIALKVGFSNITYSEDYDFSKRVLPLLHKEADVGDEPIYHYLFVSKTMPIGAVE